MRSVKKMVRVGAVTLTVSGADKREGLFYDKLFVLCDRVLPGCGCDVVLLPERSATRMADRQPLEGPIFRRFQALARRHHLWLIAPLVEASGTRTYNTQVVISPRGELLGAYRKIHLAPGEEVDTAAGRTLSCFDTPWFRGGILICFDNKFPEVSRCLALRGASILFWPSYGDEVKPHRNETRCFDNNVYLVGAGVIDRSCRLPASKFERGMVMDPAGRVLARAGSADELVVADLPLDAAGRLALPDGFELFARRRPESYTGITPLVPRKSS